MQINKKQYVHVQKLVYTLSKASFVQGKVDWNYFLYNFFSFSPRASYFLSALHCIVLFNFLLIKDFCFSNTEV